MPCSGTIMKIIDWLFGSKCDACGQRTRSGIPLDQTSVTSKFLCNACHDKRMAEQKRMEEQERRRANAAKIQFEIDRKRKDAEEQRRREEAEEKRRREEAEEPRRREVANAEQEQERIAKELGIPCEATNEKDGTLLLLVPGGKEEDPPFYLAIHPTTNAQYLRFVQETGHRPPNIAETGQPTWRGHRFPPEKADHPVVCVSGHDANAYCKWAGLRLPSAMEWRMAAAGLNGTRYPWGNDWDAKKCWKGKGWDDATCSVWSYPEGRSCWGHYNMVGSTSEWCQNEDDEYGCFVLRGGQYDNNESRTYHGDSPLYCYGFRPARSVAAVLSTTTSSAIRDESVSLEENSIAEQRDKLLTELSKFRFENNSYASSKAIHEIATLLQAFPESQAAVPMREQLLNDMQTYPLWEAGTLAMKSYVPFQADYMSQDACLQMNKTLLEVAARALHWVSREPAGNVVHEQR